MRIFKESLITTLTWLIVLLFFFPIAWMVITALKSENDAAAIPPRFDAALNLDQFRAVLDTGISDYLTNSLTASIGSTSWS
jgi:sorbitol/mannitol transport system permease protein